MKIEMIHTELGVGTLTTESAYSSYGSLVFVAREGGVFGCGDVLSGYLHKLEWEEYSPEQIAWVDQYIIESHLNPNRYDNINRRWLVWTFGASWKTDEQLKEIKKRSAKQVYLS